MSLSQLKTCEQGPQQPLSHLFQLALGQISHFLQEYILRAEEHSDDGVWTRCVFLSPEAECYDKAKCAVVYAKWRTDIGDVLILVDIETEPLQSNLHFSRSNPAECAVNISISTMDHLNDSVFT